MAESKQTIDLTPKRVDLTVSNCQWSLHFRVKPGGVPTNLTGYTIEAIVRPKADPLTPVALTITPDDLTEGTFWVGQSAALIDQTGTWGIALTPSGGAPRAYVEGLFEVHEGVAP